MANNPNVNKVVYGNQTLIDLTSDTVEASNLLEGETAHDRSGSIVTGAAKQGHSILNKLGTLLTQRSKLKFGGMLRTTDDDTNGVTVVSDEAEEIEWSVWSAMTEVEQNAYSAGKKLDILHAPLVQSNKAPKTDIATVESGSTASRAYSVGELVYVNGDLYKVITAIASGATFTVGTNIQSTNVGNLLNQFSVIRITSFGGSDITRLNGTLTKIGNVCILVGSWQGSASNQTTILTLPTQYRPSSVLSSYGAGGITINGVYYKAEYTIFADGTVKQAENVAAGTSGTFTFVYSL